MCPAEQVMGFGCYRRCGLWLLQSACGLWLLQSAWRHTHTVIYFGCSGWVMCTWITCANRRSVNVLLLTWTNVLLIILCSPVSVAVSAPLGAAAALPQTASPIMAQFGPLNLPESQESRMSSVQLSSNRVQSDFDVDAEDLYPLFDKSPVSDGDLSLISPATTHESISTDSEGEAESFHSADVSWATSASMPITHHTAPLPSLIRVETDPALLLQLATAYHEWLPQPLPDPVPVSVAIPRGAFRMRRPAQQPRLRTL